MATLIDFTDDRSRAFARGVAKGMASPVMIFCHNSAKLAPLAPLDLHIPVVSTPKSLQYSDWDRIGKTLKCAVRQHEKALKERRR